MKRVYPCYHFSCNPCVFIVLSSACGSVLLSSCVENKLGHCHLLLRLFATHVRIRVNNACVTVDKGLGSIKHSSRLTRYHSYCIKS